MPATRSIGTALLGLDADASGYQKAATRVIQQTRRMQTGTTSLVRDVRSLGTASRFARERVGALGTSIGKSVRSMLTLRNAIVTVAGGAGIGLLIKNTVGFGAELGRLSERLGTSANFILQLQFALRQAGGQAEQANDAIQELGQRVAEARVETGELFGSFEEIGRLDLLANITNAQGVEAQFAALRNAVSQISDVNERLRVADGTFGEVGRTMLSLLPVYDQLIIRANKLGIALTDQQVEAAKEADAAFSALGVQIKVLTSQAVLANIDTLTEAFEDLAEILPDLVTGLVSAAGAVLEFFGADLESQIKEAEAELAGINVRLQEQRDLLAEMSVDNFINSLLVSQDAIDEVRGRVNLLALESLDAGENLAALRARLAAIQGGEDEGTAPAAAAVPIAPLRPSRGVQNFQDFAQLELNAARRATAFRAAEARAFGAPGTIDIARSDAEIREIERVRRVREQAFIEEQELIRQATISSEEHYERVFAAAERAARAADDFRAAEARRFGAPGDIDIVAIENRIRRERAPEEFRAAEARRVGRPGDIDITAIENRIKREQDVIRDRTLEAQKELDEAQAAVAFRANEQRARQVLAINEREFEQGLRETERGQREYERGVDRHIQDLSHSWQDYYDGLERRAEELAEQQQRFNDIFVDSLDAGFARAIEGAENFGDAMTGVLREIASELLRTQITRPFTQSLVGGIGSFLGGFGGVPDLSGAFAGGGYARAGGAYLVGEQGPEIFTPGMSGQVIPNNAIGGQTVNISMNQNIYTDNSEILRVVGEATTNQINEALNRFAQVQSRPGELRRLPT